MRTVELLRRALPVLLLSTLFLAGCGRTILLSGSRPQAPAPTPTAQSPLAAQADAAWQAGNMPEAMRLYRVIANDVTQQPGLRALACEKLARMALAGGDTKNAASALEQWKLIDSKASQSPTWQELSAQALGQQPTPGSTAFSSNCVVLALPASGSYAPFGTKILNGAKAAQSDLAQKGARIDLRVIDTEQPNWLTELQQLPPQCVAVGGPLRHDRYSSAKQGQALQNRALFAFLPRIEGSDEGSVAWRFFASPEDQIHALLNFTEDLGISSYGVLAPADTYGQGMTNLFTRAVGLKGGQVKTASYPANDVSSWQGIMSSFIGSYMKGKVPVPSTTFQAAFMPDSWHNLELMTPYLFYQGEDRLVLMGTSLWEQGLSSKTTVNVANLDLAVFPGAWNPEAASAPAQALTQNLAGAVPNFWEGVGFDFVRLASALNLTAPTSALDINQRLTAAQSMDWAMAPIRWTNGRAAQQLFIFQPTGTGFKLVDKEAFRSRLQEIKARHARRVGK